MGTVREVSVMSRYIDIDKVLMALRLDHKDVIYIDKNDTAKRIEKIQGIDIVRCKECKHNYNTAINHGKMQPRCDFTDWKLSENDYCSRGEREGE